MFEAQATFAYPFSLRSLATSQGVACVSTLLNRYSVMKSRARARPKSAIISDEPGPGTYTLQRNGIDIKDPLRPSSAFARGGNGKFNNVGGSYAEWMGIEVKPPKLPWE